MSHTPTLLIFTDGGDYFSANMLPASKTVEQIKQDCADRTDGEIFVIALPVRDVLRACNSHDALVSALEDLLTTHPVMALPNTAPEWKFLGEKIKAAKSALTLAK